MADNIGTVHHPKSPQAHAQALAAWIDLQNNPFGTQGNESLTVPKNYVIPPARIYVINHSRTRKWKHVIVPVSERRGAEEVLIFDKELAKIYSIDTLYKRIEQGKDMNRYSDEGGKAGEPYTVVYKMQVGSPIDGRPPIIYGIPPARNKETPPPRVEVVEGTWDLYLGNYQRMRSKDARVVSEERANLAVRWRGRHNPVFRYTDDGETTDLGNEFGFLEFVREPQRAVTVDIDKEYLSALDMIEA